MYNSQIPSSNELPSSSKLIKSTIIAIIVAVVLTVTVVFPAEYGKYPTGIGSLLGLTNMGEIKQSLAEEAKNNEEGATPTISKKMDVNEPVKESLLEKSSVNSQVVSRQDEMKISLAPNEGTEVKVQMKKGATTLFTWNTDSAKANFDIHGDSKELNIDYHKYGKGSKDKDENSVTADFEGSHGIFWRNRSGKPMVIHLKTTGEYSEIKEVR
jgi:hypothetical protein